MLLVRRRTKILNMLYLVLESLYSFVSDNEGFEKWMTLLQKQLHNDIDSFNYVRVWTGPTGTCLNQEAFNNRKNLKKIMLSKNELFVSDSGWCLYFK